MTTVLLNTDPLILTLILGCWIWAAVRATSLPYATSPRSLSRKSRGALALVGVGLALTVVRVGAVATLASASWWFAQEKVVLSLPLLLVGAAVTAFVTVPRLLSLRAAARAFNGVNAMPPALRHDAAHPLLAWPAQLAAFAAAAGEMVFFVASYPAMWGSSLVAVAGVALAAAVSWSLLGRRHRRFGADAVVVPRRPVRLIRSTATVATLGVLAVTLGLLAVVATAPSATAHDTGHQALDLGGGSGPTPHSGSDSSVDKIRTGVGGEPVHRFILTARHTQLTHPSGSTVDAMTFDGLRHAAEGIVFRLAYEGVTTPYRMEGMNHPE